MLTYAAPAYWAYADVWRYRNSDDEALILAADGLLVWLSHPGINKAVVIRQVLSRGSASA